MYLERSQPATTQWPIDFSAAAECQHYHLSVMRQRGYNCFDMRSHTEDAHPADAFKSSKTASRRKRRMEPVHEPFTPLRPFLTLQVKIDKVFIFSSFLDRKVRGRTDYSVFHRSDHFFFNLRCGFTGKLKNKIMKGWGKERRKRQQMTQRGKIFGWIVQHHGYEEEFLNSREGKLLFEQERTHALAVIKGDVSEWVSCPRQVLWAFGFGTLLTGTWAVLWKSPLDGI